MVGSVLLEVGVATVQVLIGYLWPASGAFLVGALSSLVWRLRKSRAAESLDRTVAASVAVKGMSRSLRREGVPDADRHRLAIKIWRRNLDLDDPPSQ